MLRLQCALLFHVRTETYVLPQWYMRPEQHNSPYPGPQISDTGASDHIIYDS